VHDGRLLAHDALIHEPHRQALVLDVIHAIRRHELPFVGFGPDAAAG
jgi:hypothetical protein